MLPAHSTMSSPAGSSRPFAPPLPTHNSSSKATSLTISSPSHLQQLHANLIKTNTSLSSLPLPSIASLCAHSSLSTFSYARRLLDEMPNKDEIFVWNSCLHSLSVSPSPSSALLLFARLRLFDIVPDVFTLSFVLKACSDTSSALPFGRAIHGLIEKLGFRSDVFLFNTLVQMYASRGSMEDARYIFDRMVVKDVVTWNIMITQFTKRGEMRDAREFFGKMPKKSVRSWTALIAGYVQCGNPQEAIRLFYEMENDGFRPNEVTVVAVLAACAELGALDLGRRVHESSDRLGFLRNVRVCNTLIDMYIKCGCLEIARSVFDEMEERTIVSWSVMIAGHAMHGEGDEALSLFSRMTQIGVLPNAVTFVGLLHACSHMGLVVEGRRFFDSMIKDYGIVPEIEHYGCMVDLLSRAGLLEEARELILNMPIKPNGVIWGALLGGARVYKNVQMGEEAIQHLSELDPLNDGYYVVLSNIYAEAGRFDDSARVRRLMRDRGVKKTPGWSTVTLDGIVHKFVAGESDHPKIEDIYEKWEELLVKLKLTGYVPDTSAVLLDMDQAEKERVLYRHSEKLAVVFGMMSTPPGTPLRIIKNLRVCSDCHAALKLISDITGRQIVVRDRNRFHCFKHGFCTCRDYW